MNAVQILVAVIAVPLGGFQQLAKQRRIEITATDMIGMSAAAHLPSSSYLK